MPRPGHDPMPPRPAARLGGPPRRRLPRPPGAAPAAAALASALAAGCAGSVAVEPAVSATADACAALVADLPATVGGEPARGTGGAAGTAAWGDPAVILRCGTPLTPPVPGGCVVADGVDWVVLAEDGGAVLLAAYGRVPGVEVEVPAALAPADVLPDLAGAVGALPQERACA